MIYHASIESGIEGRDCLGLLGLPELVRDEMKGVFNISPHKLLPLCCLVVLIPLFYVAVIISPDSPAILH